MPSIVGTWKLVSATARDAAGAALSVVCDGRAELPSGVRREYSSHCGACARLVPRVDAASDPSQVGGDQARGVRLRASA
jgi:hypothetical protein